jgi:hypothetical protein
MIFTDFFSELLRAEEHKSIAHGKSGKNLIRADFFKLLRAKERKSFER